MLRHTESFKSIWLEKEGTAVTFLCSSVYIWLATTISVLQQLNDFQPVPKFTQENYQAAETLLNGVLENCLQKMLYEPITHNTAKFSMHVAALPSVCAPVCTISSNNHSPAAQHGVQGGRKILQSV